MLSNELLMGKKDRLKYTKQKAKYTVHKINMENPKTRKKPRGTDLPL